MNLTGEQSLNMSQGHQQLSPNTDMIFVQNFTLPDFQAKILHHKSA